MNRRLVSRIVSATASIVSATCMVGASQALAGDSVVASTSRATAVDAFDDRLVWSDWDASQGAYRLVELAASSVRALPVAPRPNSFDVDLGPDSRGRPIAVYSRCRLVLPFGYVDGRRGCDLYEYSFDSSRERKLNGSSSSADEYFPTVWRDRISFTRTYRARGRENPRRMLYWRTRSGRRPSHRLRSDRNFFHPVPRDLDMRGRRVAVNWIGDFSGAEIRVSLIGGRPRLISTVPGSGAATVEYSQFGISIVGGTVYWMVTDGSALGELRRHRIAARFDERALTAFDESISAFAQDGEVAYYARPASGERCSLCQEPLQIHRVDGLDFEHAPRLKLR